jgi:hypothetical protein
MAAKEAVAPAKARSWIWAQGLSCGLLVATAAPLAVTLGVLFAPAAAALVLAPVNGRRMAGVLLVFGLAAALPWLDVLWSAARDWAASLDLLGGMRLVGVCWGAQAAGWLLGEGIPMVSRLVLETRVRARIARLREARERLQVEWGLVEEEKGEA